MSQSRCAQNYYRQFSGPRKASNKVCVITSPRRFLSSPRSGSARRGVLSRKKTENESGTTQKLLLLKIKKKISSDSSKIGQFRWFWASRSRDNSFEAHLIVDVSFSRFALVKWKIAKWNFSSLFASACRSDEEEKSFSSSSRHAGATGNYALNYT